MKLLSLKLAIFVLVLFGLVIAGIFAYRPLKIRYYADKYENSTDPAERIRIVDILCNCGENGKAALYQAFRKRCISEQVKIPAGSFMMGSEKGSFYEKPVHEVKLSGFWMDKYEVTNEKYSAFVRCTGRKVPIGWLTEEGNPHKNRELQPILYISWKDAKAYADWLGMRLPTEAEWEYACRAGTTGNYHFGNNITLLGEYAWFKENSGDCVHNVGLKKPNNWGLYDMYGNVPEWCADRFGEDYYTNSHSDNPEGPEKGKLRVLRGGFWCSDADDCCSFRRKWFAPDVQFIHGFRLARSSE
ncbi:MAG: formylglycine-generating enzyme family protein [Planctomycetota bacterium]|jgi:formylglycine-generating enzyme required for sulfatase activity